MLILKLITKIFQILNSDETPLQVGLGMALGAVIALTPFLSMHNLVILLLLCVLNVSFKSGTLALLVLKPIGLLLNPLSHQIGVFLLIDLESLRTIWVGLHTTALYPWFGLNNTVRIGSLLLALILFVPMVFAFKALVIKYRRDWQEKWLKSKFYVAVKASPWLNWIFKIYGWMPG